MPEKHADYTGPITMYFDLCRETKYEGGAFTLEVLSPAAEVHLEAGPAPAAAR
jgi:hypothetical protein